MDLNQNSEGVHGQMSVNPLHAAGIEKKISQGHQFKYTESIHIFCIT